MKEGIRPDVHWHPLRWKWKEGLFNEKQIKDLLKSTFRCSLKLKPKPPCEPHSHLQTTTWLWGAARLGGGAWVALVLAGNRDGAVSAASVYAGSLGSTKSEQAISGQCAVDGRLVHVGRQAVATVELTGDVAVIILRGQPTETKNSVGKGHVYRYYLHFTSLEITWANMYVVFADLKRCLFCWSKALFIIHIYIYIR